MKSNQLLFILSFFSLSFCCAQNETGKIFGSSYISSDSLKLDTNFNKKILGEWFLHKVKSKNDQPDTLAKIIQLYKNNSGDLEYGRKSFLWEVNDPFLNIYFHPFFDSTDSINSNPVKLEIEKIGKFKLILKTRYFRESELIEAKYIYKRRFSAR